MPVTFTLKPTGAAGAIYLAGTFNDWNSSQDAMKDEDGDGVYEITLNLKPASYEYKFVQDGNWMEDPFASSSVPDPYGGKNSVVVVPDGADKLVVGVKAKGEKPAGGAAAATGQAQTPAPAAGASQAVAKGPAGTVPVTFLFDAGKGSAATIYLAGTFNGWDAAKDRMTDPDGDGIYEITMHLAPGSCPVQVREGRLVDHRHEREGVRGRRLRRQELGARRARRGSGEGARRRDVHDASREPRRGGGSRARGSGPGAGGGQGAQGSDLSFQDGRRRTCSSPAHSTTGAPTRRA